jgi:hypothetical protein
MPVMLKETMKWLGWTILIQLKTFAYPYQANLIALPVI